MKKELLSVQLASILPDSPYEDRKKALFFIHDFDFNANTFRITEELCSATNPKTGKPNYDSLNGSPLVCATEGDDLKGHEPEFDNEGNIIRLKTQSCGTLFDTHIGTHEINEKEVYGLWASGYLWLRFENTLEVIENIFNSCGSVDTSVEVMTGGYEMSEEGRTAKKSLIYTGHCLLGTKVQPAYADSGMYEFNMEVAEAFNKDLSLSNKDKDNIDNVLNGGGNVFKFLFELNADESTVSFAEMRKMMNSHLGKINSVMRLKKQMMNLNAMDSEAYGAIADSMLSMMSEDSNYYDFWIPEDGMFEGYCVCSDWYNGLFKMDWSINSNEVTMSNPRKARIIYADDDGSNTVVNSIIKEASEFVKKSEELEKQISEKDTEISSLKEDKEKLNTDLETAQKELSTKNEALKTTETESAEKIIKLGESIDGLKVKLAEVEPVVAEYNKVQAELAEKAKAEKIEEMKKFALNSKVITEKEIAEDETIKQMISELNEVNLKSLIADRIVETNAKETKVEVAEKNKDITIIVATEGEDLISKTLKEKYIS